MNALRAVIALSFLIAGIVGFVTDPDTSNGTIASLVVIVGGIILVFQSETNDG